MTAQNQRSSPTAVVNIELTDPEGTIRGQVEVDTGPLHLADLVPTAYELTMVLSGRANQRAEREGKPISCQAGCGACCRQLVPVSPPEAFYLYNLICSFETERRNEVVSRFEHIASELVKHEMVEELFNPKIDDSPVLEVSRRYFMMQMPCPFLENESCSIHPHRPVACREYNVTSPAEWCARPMDYEIAKVPMPMPLSLPLTRLTSELIGAKAPLVPLSLVPQWVEQNRKYGQMTWPGMDLFKGLMKYFSGGGSK